VIQMPFKYFKVFEKDAIGAGLTYEDSWDADEDLVLKRVYIARKDGAALTASTFYLKVKDRVHTLPVVPAALLKPDATVTPILDLHFARGEKLTFTFKNLEGVSISIYVTFEAHVS